MSEESDDFPKLSVTAWLSLMLLVFGFSAAISALATNIRGRAADASLDPKLQKVISLYEIRPLSIRRYEADPKWRLGQALFFDPVLSGNRDVSCATCHLLQNGLSDGLPRSIGANGEGLGADRRRLSGPAVHPRHALDLWNRDNNAVSAFFWDGHVEVLDAKKRIFRSPLGTALPRGFENAMAVQAAFPLTIPDEMLGYFGERSSSKLPAPHAGRANDLVTSRAFRNNVVQIQSVHTHLLMRLFGKAPSPEPWQLAYRAMFRAAYPAKRLTELNIVDVGNAIAHFEELAFAAADSPWDRYVSGDVSAIPDQAKMGALLFYGKARCAACHSGPLFSDFQYHGIGIFSKINVNGRYVDDRGRGDVTQKVSDNYHFRTSPLRNVGKIGPYFHDGSTSSLIDALERHTHPLAKAGAYNPDGSFTIEKAQADSISPILAGGIDLNEAEMSQLTAFLSSLESQSRTRAQIVPRKVPSGLPVSYK